MSLRAQPDTSSSPARTPGLSPFIAYPAAFSASALACAIRVAVDAQLPQGFPFLTFFPAVIFSAFFLGTGPGVVCAIAGGLFSWYFFLPPFGSWMLYGPGYLAMAFYIFIVMVDIALIHLMRVAQRRLEASQVLTEQLYDHQRTMFQELQHRVANNMTLVASLLHLQRRKAGPEGAAALDEARERIETMARIHRRLYDPALVDRPVEEVLRDVVTDLTSAAGRADVSVRVTSDELQLDLSRLITVTMLVTELVTNSLKHAFSEVAACQIVIALERRGADAVLSVADNGRGITAVASAASSGLGTRIIEGFVSQLRGSIDYEDRDGLTVRVTFPAAG
jgi:two-component sensor histidine kinase